MIQRLQVKNKWAVLGIKSVMALGGVTVVIALAINAIAVTPLVIESSSKSDMSRFAPLLFVLGSLIAASWIGAQITMWIHKD